MLIAFGFFLSSIMGLLLGLIGSGGSMLTVPILVYLFGMKPLAAAGYSLLVVGSTAAVGVVSYWRQGLIKTRDTFVFVLPSTLMILLTRGYIVPAMPDPLLTLWGHTLLRATFIMSLFAFLMLLTGSLMLKPIPERSKDKPPYEPYDHPIKLCLGSGIVGLLAGLVGAGGGFLIIPVLILLFGLSMKQAIGTSLAVIMVNSLLGFQGDWLIAGIKIDWTILGPFLGLAILGIFVGIKFNKRVDGVRLKRGFAVFMLCLGVSILLKEMYVFV